MTDCLFCKIIAREIQSDVIYEDADTFAFLDIHPNNPGHTLVVPKKHFRNIFDIDSETMRAVGKTTKMMATAIKESGLGEGVNVISNNESAAGQLIFHAHTHVIPRLENDGYKHWLGKEYAPGEAETIADKIKKAL